MRLGLIFLVKAFLVCLLAGLVQSSKGETQTVARIWNDACLEAIKIDFPHPPVHARNLFHLSVAMYDAWAAYDPVAVGYINNEAAVAGDIPAARHEAVSYAAYTVLAQRYALSVNSTQSLVALGVVMTNLGYSTSVTNTSGPSASAVGLRCGRAILDFALEDGALETNNYVDVSYTPVNDPLILTNSCEIGQDFSLDDPNRWQPLAFEFARTQNGLDAKSVQEFVGAQWGNVRPFALMRASPSHPYLDPGPPPMIWAGDDSGYISNAVTVIQFSSLLDPDLGNMIDIGPRGPLHNNPLGTYAGIGYVTNPATGLPYETNLVNHADFGRVAAEIWADGPDSETPPGHWNVLANEVVQHTNFTYQFKGVGPALDPLEWDVKMYFVLNAAEHDAATAAWTLKRFHDYVRPISAIRWMAVNGQRSEPGSPSYHTNGLPLVTNLIELITTSSTAAGQKHEHLAGNEGEIAIFSWPGEPDDITNQYSGVQWTLACDWHPYQRDSFVTPAFAGYVSGHSCFSRAGAEVLTLMTGDPYFPGGMGSFTAAMNSLNFELGPSAPVVLQWATYYDAADEAGISRLYGGIHGPVDDLPGRVMGSQAGIGAFELAEKYFDGSILTQEFAMTVSSTGGAVSVSWDQYIGMSYRVETSTNLPTNFGSTNDYLRAGDWTGSLISTNASPFMFYRVDRAH
jgi:hypothetical protein